MSDTEDDPMEIDTLSLFDLAARAEPDAGTHHQTSSIASLQSQLPQPSRPVMVPTQPSVSLSASTAVPGYSYVQADETLLRVRLKRQRSSAMVAATSGAMISSPSKAPTSKKKDSAASPSKAPVKSSMDPSEVQPLQASPKKIKFKASASESAAAAAATSSSVKGGASMSLSAAGTAMPAGVSAGPLSATTAVGTGLGDGSTGTLPITGDSAVSLALLNARSAAIARAAGAGTAARAPARKGPADLVKRVIVLHLSASTVKFGFAHEAYPYVIPCAIAYRPLSSAVSAVERGTDADHVARVLNLERQLRSATISAPAGGSTVEPAKNSAAAADVGASGSVMDVDAALPAPVMTGSSSLSSSSSSSSAGTGSGATTVPVNGSSAPVPGSAVPELLQQLKVLQRAREEALAAEAKLVKDKRVNVVWAGDVCPVVLMLMA